MHHLIPAHYYLDDGLFTVKISHYTHTDQGSIASMQHYHADFLRTLVKEDNIMMNYAALLLTHLAHSTVSCTLFLYYMTKHDVIFAIPKSLTHHFHLLLHKFHPSCYKWLGLGQCCTASLSVSNDQQ
jgi:hypothetical protein